jgi:hypothetical protein
MIANLLQTMGLQDPNTASAIASLVTAAATIVLMLTTIVYAVLTGILAKETRRLRHAGTEPDVVAFLRPHPVHLVVIDLVVVNVGQGPARDVEIEFEANAADFAAHAVRYAAGVRRKIMAVMPQDERYVQVFGFGEELHKGGQLKDFTLHVHFKDTKGNTRRNSASISIQDFEGHGALGEPPDYRIAKAMERVANQIEGWSSSTGRLKIETMTVGEQAEHDRQLAERIRSLRIAQTITQR